MRGKILLLIMAILATSASGDAIFSDDFESGTLDNWTIGGRQQGGVNIAEVVDRHGSQMAHVHHSETSTEITIEKIFDYDSGLEFSFDMEVIVASDMGPTSADYARGGVQFGFYDSSEENIGNVAYVLSTSSWLFDYDDSYPTLHYSDIGDGSLNSYTLDIQNVLSNIDVDPSSVASLNFYFYAYSSGSADTMSADVWVDNVTVTPEPATVLLFAAAGAFALGRGPRPRRARGGRGGTS